MRPDLQKPQLRERPSISVLSESALKSNLENRLCLWFDKLSLVNWCEVQIWSLDVTKTQKLPHLQVVSKSEIRSADLLSSSVICDLINWSEREREAERVSDASLLLTHAYPLLAFPAFPPPFISIPPLLCAAPFLSPSLTYWHTFSLTSSFSSVFISPCFTQHLSNSVVGPVVSSRMVFMITLWVHSDLGHYSQTIDGAVHTG